MSDIITTTGRTAQTIAAEICTLDTQGKHICLLYIFEIGKRLVEAKSLVDHGEWGEYLATEVSYSQDTANKYMKVYREYNVNGVFPNSDTFMNLDFSKAYKLLAVPAEEREDFAKQNNVADMTARQLDQAIKERNAAYDEKAATDAALEKIRAELRDTEQNLLAAQQQAAAAKSSESSWQAEIDKLNAALNKATAAEEKAKQKLKDLKENPNIPDAVKEKLVAEARAEAAAEATADLHAQLDAAQKSAADAAQEKATAEAAAKAAQEALANAQKSLRLSNPDVLAFELVLKQMQQNINILNGYRLKVKLTDPELGDRLKGAALKGLEALKTMVEQWQVG